MCSSETELDLSVRLQRVPRHSHGRYSCVPVHDPFALRIMLLRCAPTGSTDETAIWQQQYYLFEPIRAGIVPSDVYLVKYKLRLTRSSDGRLHRRKASAVWQFESLACQYLAHF